MCLYYLYNFLNTSIQHCVRNNEKITTACLFANNIFVSVLELKKFFISYQEKEKENKFINIIIIIMHRNHHRRAISPPPSTSRQPTPRISDVENVVFSFAIPSSSFNDFDGMDMRYLQDRIGGFNDALKQLHLARTKAHESFDKVLSLQKQIREDPSKENSSVRERLNELYRLALIDAETEVQLNRQVLDLVGEIRSQARVRFRKMSYGIRRGELMKLLVDCAHTLPLFIGMFYFLFFVCKFYKFIGKTFRAKAPPLCGAVPYPPDYICKSGDLVAANVIMNNERNWILAEVCSYKPTTDEYDVDDIDEEQKERHTLPSNMVIPLPSMRANPETNPEAFYRRGTQVLALYPQTTCFYRGIVGQVPHSLTACYRILFEDHNYADGYSPPMDVPQRYVIVERSQNETTSASNSTNNSSSISSGTRLGGRGSGGGSSSISNSK